jgi:RNA polymerase sigma-70 factor (ECF subfamily)
MAAPRWRVATWQSQCRSASDDSENTEVLEPESRRAAAAPTFQTKAHSLRGALVAVALRVTGNLADAEDVVQTLFLRIHEGTYSTTVVSDARGWLFTVARRLAIDGLRRDRHRQRSQGDPDTVAASPPEQPPAWSLIAPEDLDGVLASCADCIRETFELWWQGLSYREIAERTRVGVPTVATRVYRAKSHLRAALLDTGRASTKLAD